MKQKYFTGGMALKQGPGFGAPQAMGNAPAQVQPQYFTGGMPLNQGPFGGPQAMSNAPAQMQPGQGNSFMESLAGLLGGGGGQGGGGGGGIMQLFSQIFGGGGQGGGGGGAPSIQSLLGLLQGGGGGGGPQAMGNYQQVGVGGPLGGIDIPPADMGDPFRWGDVYSPHEMGSFNPTNMWQGGQPGFPWSPTMIPTTYNPQGYPYAVPVSTGDVNTNAPNWFHAGQTRKNQ